MIYVIDADVKDIEIQYVVNGCLHKATTDIHKAIQYAHKRIEKSSSHFKVISVSITTFSEEDDGEPIDSTTIYLEEYNRGYRFRAINGKIRKRKTKK